MTPEVPQESSHTVHGDVPTDHDEPGGKSMSGGLPGEHKQASSFLDLAMGQEPTLNFK